MPIKAPFLPPGRIREIADEFLAKYHPSRVIPIPIEEIVEFSLDIDIVPIPGLHQSFAIDSMISSDFRCISIDEHVLTSRLGRYRFSLAHEVGHREMHAGIFKELRCASIAEWKTVITDMIPQREYDFLGSSGKSIPSSSKRSKGQKGRRTADHADEENDSRGLVALLFSAASSFLVCLFLSV